jgi:hypothetical protein
MGRAFYGKFLRPWHLRILHFVTSSTAIKYFEQDAGSSGIPVLYYYFNFREPATQTCENFLRSVLFQLLRFLPDIPASLRALYKNHNNGGRRPSTEDMIECFLDIVETMKEVRLLGDAFDECVAWNDLWHLLSRISRRKCSSLRFLFTSRPESSIREAVHTLDIPTIDLSSYEEIDADITSFVDENLQSNPRFSRISDEGKTLIRDSLISRADRM